MYYTYIIRCEDFSLYTGITTSLERRMKEHISQGDKCAKYTKRHKIESLEAAWESIDRSKASKLEYEIKKLTKAQKEELIKDNRNFKKLLNERLECKNYKRYNKQKLLKGVVNLNGK